MISIQFVLLTIAEGVVNLLFGIWFLICHPITFIKFSNEYRKFAAKIDDNDQVAQSGFYNMPRRDRRAMTKRARKIAEECLKHPTHLDH